jgi:hypothetical protein
VSELVVSGRFGREWWSRTIVGGNGGRELLWEGVVVFVSGGRCEWWSVRVSGGRCEWWSVRVVVRVGGGWNVKRNKNRRNIHMGHHWWCPTNLASHL